MDCYSATKKNNWYRQWPGWIPGVMLSEKNQSQRLHPACVHLPNILEKTKGWKWRTDSFLPQVKERAEVGRGDEYGYERATWGVLRGEKCSASSLYRCRCPGCHTVLLVCKMLPLEETRGRAPGVSMYHFSQLHFRHNYLQFNNNNKIQLLDILKIELTVTYLRLLN